MKVKLYESNAGDLWLTSDDKIFYDVTELQSDSSFTEDAKALFDGDTDNWTVESFDSTSENLPTKAKLVAEWTNEQHTVYLESCGHAAKNYLKIPKVKETKQ